MLHTTEQLTGCTLLAEDGRRVGPVVNLLFDDEEFTVRYLVVDAADWLPGRRVLIAPEAIGSADLAADIKAGELKAGLSPEQIESSPPLQHDEPVSQEHTRELSLHYGWDAYTAYHPVLGGRGAPDGQKTDGEDEREASAAEPGSGAATHLSDNGGTGGTGATLSRLRSLTQVTGYDIDATDGEVGHIEDLVIDTLTWSIKYLVVATDALLPEGRRVLIPIAFLRGIAWEKGEAGVQLGRGRIESSPEFDPSLPVTTPYEAELSEHYGSAPAGGAGGGGERR